LLFLRLLHVTISSPYKEMDRWGEWEDACPCLLAECYVFGILMIWTEIWKKKLEIPSEVISVTFLSKSKNVI
jgi:hypothetical protein